MKKSQRRARLKAARRRGKLAPVDGAGAEPVVGDVAGDVRTAADDLVPVESAPVEVPESPVRDDAADGPVLVDDDFREDAVRYVREQAAAKIAEARAAVAAAKAEYPQLDDDRARAMLVLAAEFLHEVVADTREALAQVPAEQRREALAIINEKPEPSDVSSVKRPRRGPNPVVSLMRVGMQAASLLQRVLGKTNPELGRLKRAA